MQAVTSGCRPRITMKPMEAESSVSVHLVCVHIVFIVCEDQMKNIFIIIVSF